MDRGVWGPLHQYGVCHTCLGMWKIRLTLRHVGDHVIMLRVLHIGANANLTVVGYTVWRERADNSSCWERDGYGYDFWQFTNDSNGKGITADRYSEKESLIDLEGTCPHSKILTTKSHDKICSF